MKTQAQKTRNIFLTGCMLICVSAGWVLGSITTDVFSQSRNRRETISYSGNTIFLPSTFIKGESIPTVFFSEIIITAY